MGRAFGLFLLVVGIGLAAYGIPATDQSWQASEVRSAPAASDAVAGAAVAANPATATVDDRRPMDKLRGLAPRPTEVGVWRPSSQGQVKDLPKAPYRQPEVAAAKPLPPVAAPSIVSSARREATAPAADVAKAPVPLTVARPVNKPVPDSGSTAPGATAMAPLPIGAASQVAAAPSALVTSSIRLSSPTGPSVVGGWATSVKPGETAKPGEPAPAAKQALVEKPVPAEPKRVAQKYSPPVYLGKPSEPSRPSGQSSGSSSSGASNTSSSKGSFRANDLWERARLSGS